MEAGLHLFHRQFIMFSSVNWNMHLKKDFPVMNLNHFLFWENLSNLVKLEGNGLIDGYIRYELTGGHCPFHQVFHIETEGEHAFFGGDVAPQLNQMKNRFVAKYDYDGRKCMDLRHEMVGTGTKGRMDLYVLSRFKESNMERY